MTRARGGWSGMSDTIIKLPNGDAVSASSITIVKFMAPSISTAGTEIPAGIAVKVAESEAILIDASSSSQAAEWRDEVISKWVAGLGAEVSPSTTSAVSVGAEVSVSLCAGPQFDGVVHAFDTDGIVLADLVGGLLHVAAAAISFVRVHKARAEE